MRFISILLLPFLLFAADCCPRGGSSPYGYANEDCCANKNCNTGNCTYRTVYESCLCGYVEVGADAIYWRSTRNAYPIFNVERASSPPQVVITQLTPTFDWGLRVWGTWSDCEQCNFINGEYFRVKTNSSERERQPLEDDILLFSTLSVESLYNGGSVIVGRHWCKSFYGYAGIHAADIVETQNLQETDNSGTPPLAFRRIRLHTTGFGPTVGVGALAKINCGLHAFGRLGVTSFVGWRRTRARAGFLLNGRDDIIVEFPNKVDILPAFDMRIGAAYIYDFCCANLRLEVGYAAYYYLDLFRNASSLEQTLTTNDPDIVAEAPAINPVYENGGFAGPYAGIAIGF